VERAEYEQLFALGYALYQRDPAAADRQLLSVLGFEVQLPFRAAGVGTLRGP
jgi:hypothetical protein